MPRLTRLRRRVLRQAVRENLDLIAGVRTPPRRPPFLARWLRTSLWTLGTLSLAAASFILVTSAQHSQALAGISAGLARSARLVARPAPPSSGGAEPTLAAPKTIEPGVLRLEVRRVVLDPGHGGVNTGTVTSQGLAEKNLTLDIGHRLRQLLEEDGFEVVMTRDRDTAMPLEGRAQLANRQAGDLFVSIHVNWIEAREVRGVETFYLGPTDDPYLTRLAAAENRGSGYSLADFRRLLERVYFGVRQDESRKLAESVQRELYRSLRRINPNIRDRGVKTAPFVVLIATDMPAILAEVSCLSNEQEARLLAKPLYRQYIADALFAGIRSYVDTLNPSKEAS